MQATDFCQQEIVFHSVVNGSIEVETVEKQRHGSTINCVLC
jgi:hypothetical protein